jgi:hypothetical protein
MCTELTRGRRRLSRLSAVEIGLMLLSAIALIFAAGRAAAQGAPAGPEQAAAPSDQPAQAHTPSAAEIGGKPNLAGAWKLNKDESDDPQQKMQDAGGYGGRGGGMRGGRGRGGRRGAMMQDLSQITVTQTESSAKVTDASGRVLAEYGSSTSNDRAAAQWQGKQLVVTIKGRRGGSNTRTFELSPDGKQLYMSTTIDNPRFQQPVTIRFVYDPAKASE